MTWREKTVVRILLMVARIISDDEATYREIETLANHISCGAPPALSVTDGEMP